MYYMDREGHRIKKTTSQDKFLKFVYTHTATRVLMRPLLLPAVYRLGGKLLNTKVSAVFAGLFARTHGIDLNKYEKQKFDSYNDFFTRKIKAEERPVNREDTVLISPCDGKVSVYPIHENGRFFIKHTPYTTHSLIRDAKLARHYMGGWAVVIRLTVDDYHRYCYVADGEKTYQRRIPGIFHTVNPIANDICPIYKMNSREYCLVKNEKLGTVLMMEVGALMVGKIQNYKKERCQVKRGEEKGRFEFGGSTVVLLLEPDKVLPDSDLIRNTLQGAETIVKMGERIGGVVCLEKNSSI